MAKAANTSNKQIETLADLTPDPRNARKHNPRNVGMLERALNEVGAARSIVIDENGVVLAGNATIEAAGRLGMERVQVVDADGETIVAVRRTGLTQTQKTRLALYDNRTAELADWDAETIEGLIADDNKILEGLFYDTELEAIIADTEVEKETNVSLKDFEFIRILISLPLSQVIELNEIMAKLQTIANIEIDYGSN